MRSLTLLVLICLPLQFAFGDVHNLPPQKIVSLNPAITRDLYLLEKEATLIGRSLYCPHPKGSPAVPVVGNLVEINIEKIISLKPDLIFITSLADNKAVQKLTRLGYKVTLFPPARKHEDIYQRFQTLAKIMDAEDKARPILHTSRKSLAILQSRLKNKPKPRVLIQVGANPLFAATKDLFINDIIKLAGGENVTESLSQGILSREEVLKLNPEYIFIVTMGVSAENEKRNWQRFTSLQAVKDEHVYILDADKSCSPTPLTLIDILNEVANLLHPKA